METDKINKIIDIVTNVPNEKWELHKDGYTPLTELNGRKITLQYGYSGMYPSIVINGVDFHNNTFTNGHNKVWELYKRLNNYFDSKEEINIASSIDSIYNALTGN